MKKQLTILSALLLAISLTSAAQITPESPQNSTLNPGEDITQQFDIEFEGNDTEVRVTATDTGDYDISYQSFRRFNDDGTFTAQIEAPDKGNYTHNVQFVFEVSRQNQSDERITRDVKVTTKIPYKTFDNTPVWINESYQLDINGQKYNVSNIENNLYLNNDSIRISGTRTINDIRVQLQDIIPGEYAKIKADTKEENASFTYEYIPKPEEPEEKVCKLGIKTITTLQRGSSFAIETIDSNSETNDVVGGVSVTLIDSGKGEPIGNSESGNSGYASIYIPETTKGPVVARLAKPGDGEQSCQSNNQRVSFNRPYNVYIEENSEFQLNIQLDNSTFYSTVTGQVRNEEGGKVGSGIVQITTPNSQQTDVAFNNTGFTYKPEQSGEYQFKATKDGYVESDSTTAKYVADRDNDGIPNSKDECENEAGVEENNGCPKEKVRFQVFKDGQEYYGDLRPKEEYTIKLLNREDEVVNYTGSIPLDGGDIDIPFQNGVSQRDGAQTVAFSEAGSYGLQLNASKYEPTSENLLVENESLGSKVPLNLIGGMLLALILGIVALAAKNSGSSKSKNSTSNQEFGYDLDQLGGNN